jgi:hypothetical protein
MGRPKGSTNKSKARIAQEVTEELMAKGDNSDEAIQAAYEEIQRRAAELPTQPTVAMMSSEQRRKILELCHELKTTTSFKQNNLPEDQITYAMASAEIKHLKSLRDRQANKQVPGVPNTPMFPAKHANNSSLLNPRKAEGAVMRLAELRAVRDASDFKTPEEEAYDQPATRFDKTIVQTSLIEGYPIRVETFGGMYTDSKDQRYGTIQIYFVDEETDMEVHEWRLYNQNLLSKLVAKLDANDGEPYLTKLAKVNLPNGHTMWQMQRATF